MLFSILAKAPWTANPSNWLRNTTQTGIRLTRLQPAINWVASTSKKDQPKGPRAQKGPQTKQQPRRKPKAKRRNISIPVTISGKGGYYVGTGKDRSYVKGFAPDYGSRVGSAVGEGFQSLAEVLGFGDYQIQRNSLMSNVNMGTDPPTVRNSSRGEAFVVRHREYLGDLKSGVFTPGNTSPFAIQTYPINPGNSDLFPWLASIARHYQEWEMQGMIVELKTLSSNYAAGLSMGAMFAATQYNVLAPPPKTKIELENMEYSTSNKPSTSTIHCIECARGLDTLTHLYVTNDQNYNTGDARLYDLGNLYIGSFGIPVSNAPIAEIWVSYEVALYKPVLPTGTGQFDTEHFLITGCSATFPVGNSLLRMEGSSNAIDLTATTVTSSSGLLDFSFPNKIARYLVAVSFNLLSSSVSMGNFNWGFVQGSVTDCSFYFGWSDPSSGTNTVSLARNHNGASATGIPFNGVEALCACFIIDVPSLTSGSRPHAVLGLTSPLTAAVTASCDVWISQISTLTL